MSKSETNPKSEIRRTAAAARFGTRVCEKQSGSDPAIGFRASGFGLLSDFKFQRV
jgi:hypothetical protein